MVVRRIPADAQPVNLGKLRSRLTTGPLNPEEIEACIEDFRQGKVYTLASISKMLRCSHEKSRSIFSKEPGVVKVGVEYRVPDTIFKRALKSMMQGSR